jgi:tetratricopeptide (TPR) repeat protein
MSDKNDHSSPPRSADDLLAVARAGGPKAAKAARHAAALAELRDPETAKQALSLAIRLEPIDPAPRLALARLHAESGDLPAARAEAEAVLADAVDQAARARAAFILGELARAGGDHDEARGRYQAVLQIEDALLLANPGDPTASRWYARARGRVAELDASAGDFTAARTGSEGALGLLRAVAAAIGEPPVLAADIGDAEMRLAALELDFNQPASARRRLGEAIGRYEALAITEKHEPHWRAVLADAWALAAETDYVRGDANAARDAMERALQTRLVLAARSETEAWGLAGVWRVRGALRAALGDNDTATESFGQARAMAEKLCNRAGGNEDASRFLLRTLLAQADHALRMGQFNTAREAADSARMLTETFAQDIGGAWLGEVAACWDRLGEIARIAGAGAAAQDAFARAVEFRRLALERAPDDIRLIRRLAAALVKHGDALLAANADASAKAVFHESIVLRFNLLDAAPGDATAAHAVAVALERFGLAALAQGDTNAARAAWEDELALADRIFAEEHSLQSLRFRAIVESHLASAGGPNSEHHRHAALEHLDQLAHAGALTPQETALRKKLWGA